jgi:hypothetical protein
MRSERRQVQRLCSRIARDIGDGTPEQKLAQYEAYWRQLVLSGKERCKSRMSAFAMSAAGILVAIGVLCLVVWPEEETRVFWVGEDNAAGIRGQWLTTAPGDESRLRFEHDSSIIVRQRSAVRVTLSQNDRVVLELNEGEILADIHGNGTTRWSIDAGPFTVDVLGTKFAVTWDRDDEILDVKVKRGTVLVRGANLSDHGVKVTEGHRVRADARYGSVEFNPVAPQRYAGRPWGNRPSPDSHQASDNPRSLGSADTDVAPSPSIGRRPTDAPTAFSTLRGSSTASKGKTRATGFRASTSPVEPTGESGDGRLPQVTRDLPSSSEGDSDKNDNEPPADKGDIGGDGRPLWVALFDRGQYMQAFEEAEELGFDNLQRDLQLPELWKLMSAARKVRQDDVAEELLLVCRRRFAGSSKARRAAFVLGMINAHGKRDLVSASKWLNIYLDENPDGPLAAEAMGRLIVVYGQMGRGDEAKVAAKRYLQRYPDGVFSKIAKSKLR